MAPAEGLSSKQELSQSLDQLLEHYLSLLDQYQTLQRQMASALSSGYFSIAQANFVAPSRIRYGQDFYDGRMQANRTLSIEPRSSSDEQSPRLSIRLLPESTSSTDNEPVPASKSTPSPAETASRGHETASAAPKKTVQEKSRDPLRWFGILVPQPLRAAQADFIRTVDLAPQLAEMNIRMKQAEQGIRDLRMSMLHV
ncbi:MAG: hypothetical protein M1837_006720 [Sclerophora amabilis]|nr:MAG: hypothetical protein M1837_006720 [Sclerophora amabilis]